MRKWGDEMRLIDADAITKEKLVKFVGDQNFISFGDLLWMISEIPTVDAVPVVRGEWKFIYGNLVKFFKCNKCGKYQEFATNFCSNCGADMRKKVE